MSENKTSQLGKKAKPARGGKATAKKKKAKKTYEYFTQIGVKRGVIIYNNVKITKVFL